MNIFYVYAYLDPRKPGKYIYGRYEFDHEPFYIGKGKGNRLLEHMRLYNGGNKHKNNKIKKIIKNNKNPIIIKLFENLSEKMSLEIEKNSIELIGRKDKKIGPLLNYTDGGEGISGYKFTDEYKKIRNKSVIKYDTIGNILNKYNSIEEASIDNKVSKNSIIRCCNGGVKFSENKFIYLYSNIPFRERAKLDGNKYSIIRIDSEGIKKEYSSTEEASIDNLINKSNINAACKGIRFQAGGYIWRYNKHPKSDYYLSQINKKWKDLIPFLTKEIIDLNGIKYKNILDCLINKNFRTNGVLRFLKKKKLI